MFLSHFQAAVGVGIPWGFPHVFPWVWGLKSNPNGSPVHFTYTVTLGVFMV